MEVTWFFAFSPSVLDWIVLILVWFETSLHSAQVSGQSCPWPLKLMTSQAEEWTWIRTGAVTGGSGANGLKVFLLYLNLQHIVTGLWQIIYHNLTWNKDDVYCSPHILKKNHLCYKLNPLPIATRPINSLRVFFHSSAMFKIQFWASSWHEQKNSDLETKTRRQFTLV